MPENPADDRQSESGAGADRGVRVAEVMEANGRKAGLLPEPLPGPLESDEVLTGLLPKTDVGIPLLAGSRLEQFQSRRAEGNDLLAGLAVAKPQAGALEVHLFPAECQNLVLAGTGQEEEPERQEGRQVLRSVPLGLGKDLSEPGQLGRGEKALALVLPEALNRATGV